MKPVLRNLAGIWSAFLIFAGCTDKDGHVASSEVGGSVANVVNPVDTLAREALPSVGDLPGGDWEVAGRDVSEDDDEQLGEMFTTEPSCRPLRKLLGLNHVDAEMQDDKPAGRADIEFRRLKSRSRVPSRIDVEIDIEETAAEITEDWDAVKTLFESSETKTCFARIIAAFHGGDRLSVRAIVPPTMEPKDRLAFAFNFSHPLDDGSIVEMTFQNYVWVRDNADVSVSFVGPRDDLTSRVVTDALREIETRFRKAGDLHPSSALVRTH